MEQGRTRSHIEARQTAVFDVCDTLYFSNTTHDFVSFVMAADGGPKRAVHTLMNSRFSPLRYLFIGTSIKFGWDYLRTFNIRLLRGKTKAELEELATRFVENFLLDRQVVSTHQILHLTLSRGDRVVLCSTSIEPVVSAIAAHLGVEEFISTRLEYINGICTGSITDEIGNEKLARLEQNGICEISLAVSDNSGDLPLLRTSQKAFAVAHSARKKEFWEKCEIDIIDPNS